MTTTKTERMKREFNRAELRREYAIYSIDTCKMMYDSFLRYNRENNEYDRESYEEWFNTMIKPHYNSYVSKVRKNITNYRMYRPYKMIHTVKTKLGSQLRDKYTRIDTRHTMKPVFTNNMAGLENYYNRVC